MKLFKKILPLLTLWIFVITISSTSASSVDLIVPSCLNITFNEDETNTISNFTIENNMSVPINIDSIDVKQKDEWLLKQKSATFQIDEKAICLVVENNDLKNGNNPTSIPILPASKKTLSIDVFRGPFLNNFSATAFELVFNYSLGQSTFLLTLDTNDDLLTYELKNDEIFLLPTVTKNGYAFDYWENIDTNETYLENSNFTMPIGNTTLKAHWRLEEYEINYLLNGGSFDEDVISSYTIETEDFTIPTPKKEGYIFDGWNQEATIKKGNYGNLTFEASWRLPNVKLINNDTISIIQANRSTQIPIPSREHYTFDGWFLTNETYESFSITDFISDPLYPWTVDANGIWSSGNKNIPSSTSTLTSEPFTLTSPSTLSFLWKSNGENDCDYLGYDIYDLRNKQYMSQITSPTFHHCLKSLATASNIFKKETYDLDAGEYQLVFIYGKNETTDHNEDQGFVRDIEVYSNYQYQISNTPCPSSFQEDLVLSAKWTPKSYTYSINHLSSTNKVLKTEQITRDYGTVLEIVPTEFDGYTSPNNQEITFDEETKDIAFVYTPINFSISYVLNGGINPSSALTSYHIENNDIILPTPTRSGYTFVGWYQDSLFSTEKVITFEASDLENKIFYAKWTKPLSYILQMGASFKQTISDDITSIIFTDQKALEDVELTDQSKEGDGSVVSWVKDGVMYVSSQTEQQVIYASSCGNMFRDKTNLTSIDFKMLDTSSVTDMSYMFYGLTLTDLDLSSFNTSNVKKMNYMFRGCKKLTSLDISSFDTSNVNNMSNMFYNCISLNYIDLSHFKTSKVTNFSNMFYLCRALENINLTSFETAKVTDFSNMFYCCDKLISLDLSTFNTKSALVMGNMFWACRSLSSITLGENWYWIDDEGLLPEQSESWMSGADGKWYDINNIGYTPSELREAFNSDPITMAGTYIAKKIT